MPEYPDVTVYVEALSRYAVGYPMSALHVSSPFLVRTYDPPLEALIGKSPQRVERIGKRIVLHFPDDHFLVIHLMIAGRLRWKSWGTRPQGRSVLACFDFGDGESEGSGTLIFTEASKKKRASMHCVVGHQALQALHPNGLELFNCTSEEFHERILCENHTLKRTLTDPRLFSGIGNAYSDEILHRARLSPLQWSQRLTPQQIETLLQSCRQVLQEWVDRFRQQLGDGFPDKVTAFHEEMAVHGRYGKPCPVCESPVQRIVYAANETNYCPQCQTQGKLLADRALSRLLKKDWPRSVDEWDQHLESLKGGE